MRRLSQVSQCRRLYVWAGLGRDRGNLRIIKMAELQTAPYRHQGLRGRLAHSTIHQCSRCLGVVSAQDGGGEREGDEGMGPLKALFWLQDLTNPQIRIVHGF